MSDTRTDDQFTPMDLSSLDSFDREVSTKGPEDNPDFDRFKLLFDPAETEIQEAVFEAFYTVTKKVKEEAFVPLIEGTGGDDPPVAQVEAAPEPEEQEKEDPLEVLKKAAFDQGFEQGFAKGHSQGLEKGEAQGFEKGQKEGHAQGLEKGEAEGFAQGEAKGLELGLEKGEKQAQAEVREQASSILDPLKDSLETVDRLLDRIVERYEGQIVELVYQIAQKAVLAKLDTDDDVVKLTILDAVKNLVAPEEIRLSVSTEDYEYVEMIKDEFFEGVKTLKHVAVLSDPMIPKGGCRIESAGATVSTDPETKLKAVYDAVAGAARR